MGMRWQMRGARLEIGGNHGAADQQIGKAR